MTKIEKLKLCNILLLFSTTLILASSIKYSFKIKIMEADITDKFAVIFSLCCIKSISRFVMFAYDTVIKLNRFFIIK